MFYMILNTPLSCCTVRSSHCRCSVKKVLPKFCNVHRKMSLLKSLFNKIPGLKACSFIKKRIQHRCFPVNTVKLLRTHFEEHLRMAASARCY